MGLGLGLGLHVSRLRAKARVGAHLAQGDGDGELLQRGVRRDGAQLPLQHAQHLGTVGYSRVSRVQ